ncbi:hypothetical protein NX059_009673 [Plenodomus lindquistii]|nr:hypothetical protein NX059_009673 [Plenodomus lindquistii]
MDQLRIADLSPALPALETRQFRASVILIWPYSSSQRQFALLLADPDFRLRRKNGQVRVRFTGSSAKAIATTGVGIGDEVLLSLRGAEFVKDGAVQTPGRSIDWELEYGQTLTVQVFRDGRETAKLELDDIEPTPAPESPNHRLSLGGPSPSQHWSSPAILKRIRLSDGPFSQAPYDPFTEDIEQGHDKKRRRKSYRDWKAWTYSARTPSPEKVAHSEEDLEEDVEQLSPIRAHQLPDTPISPSKPEPQQIAADRLEEPEDDVEMSALVDDLLSSDSEADDNESRQSSHHFEYDGANEFRPEDSQYAFGGDTEIDTEVNTEEEDDAQNEPEGVSMTTTVANTEEEHTEDGLHRRWSDDLDPSDASALDIPAESASTAVDSAANAASPKASDQPGLAHMPAHAADHPAEVVETTATNNVLRLEMPPPTLPILQVDEAAPVISDLLTPVGREPSSPTLKPQDSSTLPLPSPFPGDINTSTTSYHDYFTATEAATIPETAVVNEPELPSDADYIMETSFFSSIGSSKDPSLHPNHESAFTPVRFTFGLDGAGWSRPPLDLSSPAPEGDTVPETSQAGREDSVEAKEETVPPASEHAPSSLQREAEESQHPAAAEDAGQIPLDDATIEEPGLNELSSGADTEPEGSDSEQKEHVVAAGDNPGNGDVEDEEGDEDHSKVANTQDTGAVSTIIDLGSPPVDDTQTSEADIPSAFDNPAEGHVSYQNTQQSTTLDDLSNISSTAQDDDVLMENENYSEFVNLEFAPEVPSTVAETQQHTVAHTPAQEALERGFDPVNAPISLPSDGNASSAPGESSSMMQETFDSEEPFHRPESPTQDDEFRYPEVKMESIEDDSIFETLTHWTQDESAPSQGEMQDELMIAVPEAGGKMGELHTMAVPATGPARNTRSKLSITVSPTRERTQTPRRTTRSTRSFASVTQDTLSPVETRSHATFSASQEPSQTSPYSLRSQSKLLSPVKLAPAVGPASSRRSPRKQSQKVAEDSQAETEHSLLDNHLLGLRIFDPSYDPSASQGRYSNVAYVKDSEDDSARSEHSISTANQTDEQAGAYSDPVQPSGLNEELERLKPPPASAPEPQLGFRGRRVVGRVAGPVLRSSSPLQPTSPFSVQSLAASPNRQLRSAGSAAASSEAENSVRRVSPSDGEDADELEDQTTPKATAGEGESSLVAAPYQSQQQTQMDEHMRSSPPPVITTSFPTVHQHATLENDALLSPDDTQNHTMDSQLSTHQDTQLTQATSLSLPSFQPKSLPIGPSTTEPPAVEPSSDRSTSSTPPLPSIGLSTPLAYYTPLSSLPYFLNRSSQYHSSENPDILALVTRASTVPARATRGPKHYYTTLHITDVSIYPATTSVNVFRPFETALPVAHAGDVVLLRAFGVKSVKGRPGLRSEEDSAWCVWRWGKPCWGMKKGLFGEVRAREEVRGPQVERGVGEWAEVGVIRAWWEGVVRGEMERLEAERGKSERGSQVEGSSQMVGEEESQRVMRDGDLDASQP